MANSSQTFKTGELCLEEGSYACLLCRGQDRDTIVSMAGGGIFPFCKICGEKDVTWRREGKR